MIGTGMIGVRWMSLLAALMARNTNDKYYKILKQAKPVFDTTHFREGDVIPQQVKIPLQPAAYPDYHYETQFFKRQNRGLYGGRQRKRSKTCSEAGNKNLRVHLPNIHKATLWLLTLEQKIKTRVSTKVLKTVDREGGLDNYLTKDKPARVKTLGALGWKLRYDVMKAQELKLAQAANPEVKFIADDGLLVLKNKKYLLNVLFYQLRRQLYTGLTRSEFNKNYKHIPESDVLQKLREAGADLRNIVA